MLRAPPNPRALWAPLALSLLAAAPAAAAADRVLVLELRGDLHGRLREQVESALQMAGQVEVFPLSRFERAAARAGFPGAQAVSVGAVAAMAPRFNIWVTVDGAVRRGRFAVRMLDSQGQELWGREIKLQRGLLSAQNLRKLAAAIAEGVKQARAAGTSPAQEKPPPAIAPSAQAPQEPAAQPPGRGAPPPVTRTEPPLAEVHPVPPAEPPPAEPPPQPPAVEAARPGRSAGRGPRRAPPPEPSPAGELRPFWLEAQAGATLTWRSYCARPGVSSCGAYDALPAASRPPGNTVDFAPTIPYAGFAVHAELFPLAGLDNAARGFGLVGSVGEGFSLVQVTASSGGGTPTPAKTVPGTDLAYEVGLTWRWFFPLGDERLGYLGLRGGYGGRSFYVDPASYPGFANSRRSFPFAALDVQLPFLSWLGVDVTGLYFVAPSPIPNDTENYGSNVSSSGFGAEAGISGQIAGPLGYSAHVRYLRFVDHFSGLGVIWQGGGVAQETYTEAILSATMRLY